MLFALFVIYQIVIYLISNSTLTTSSYINNVHKANENSATDMRLTVLLTGWRVQRSALFLFTYSFLLNYCFVLHCPIIWIAICITKTCKFCNPLFKRSKKFIYGILKHFFMINILFIEMKKNEWFHLRDHFLSALDYQQKKLMNWVL